MHCFVIIWISYSWVLTDRLFVDSLSVCQAFDFCGWLGVFWPAVSPSRLAVASSCSDLQLCMSFCIVWIFCLVSVSLYVCVLCLALSFWLWLWPWLWLWLWMSLWLWVWMWLWIFLVAVVLAVAVIVVMGVARACGCDCGCGVCTFRRVALILLVHFWLRCFISCCVRVVLCLVFAFPVVFVCLPCSFCLFVFWGAALLYESPRRKPGWRFTAGFDMFECTCPNKFVVLCVVHVISEW